MMEGMKVLTADQKLRLATEVQIFEASVYFKFLQSPVFKTHALLSSPGKKIMTCQRPKELAISHSGKTATINFVINSEIYFLVAVIGIDAKKIEFSIDSDVFHLSRRKNRRVRLPKGYEASWMIKRLGGQMAFLRGIMIDISELGCKLALNTDTPLVQVDQEVEGTLKITSRLPIDVHGMVRYHKLHVRKEHKQIFGIQFTHLTDTAQKRIKATVLDLEREFFLQVLE